MYVTSLGNHGDVTMTTIEHVQWLCCLYSILSCTIIQACSYMMAFSMFSGRNDFKTEMTNLHLHEQLFIAHIISLTSLFIHCYFDVAVKSKHS
jgi:hypothetical protein